MDNLKTFLCVIIGMTMLGLSIGFLIGSYFQFATTNKVYAYISAPIFGLGSGLVLYGTLFGRKIE